MCLAFKDLFDGFVDIYDSIAGIGITTRIIIEAGEAGDTGCTTLAAQQMFTLRWMQEHLTDNSINTGKGIFIVHHFVVFFYGICLTRGWFSTFADLLDWEICEQVKVYMGFTIMLTNSLPVLLSIHKGI